MPRSAASGSNSRSFVDGDRRAQPVVRLVVSRPQPDVRVARPCRRRGHRRSSPSGARRVGAVDAVRVDGSAVLGCVSASVDVRCDRSAASIRDRSPDGSTATCVAPSACGHRRRVEHRERTRVAGQRRQRRARVGRERQFHRRLRERRARHARRSPILDVYVQQRARRLGVGRVRRGRVRTRSNVSPSAPIASVSCARTSAAFASMSSPVSTNVIELRKPPSRVTPTFSVGGGGRSR